MTSPAPAPAQSTLDRITSTADPFLDPEQRSALFKSIGETLSGAILSLIYALVIFIIGYIVIKIIMWIVGKALKKRKFEEVVANFITNVVGGILKLLLFTAVIYPLGIPLLSLSAIIGALGLAIGLTLGGIMSNFVSGLMLLTRKPFVKGDYIEAQGYAGTVERIEMFSTTLLTPDNKVITIPNAPLANDTVTNYSKNDTRRVDMVVGVAYDADLQLTSDILEKICRRHKSVLKEPATVVKVHELADSSVNFVVRPWVNKADYWSFYWDFHREVKERLDTAGIGIPFPQRDVHIFEGVASEPKDIEWSESEEEVEEDTSPTKKNSNLAKKGVKKLTKGVKKGSDVLKGVGSKLTKSKKSKKGESESNGSALKKREGKNEE